MIPKDTMSRVKPGYLTFLSSVRISLGLGMVAREVALLISVVKRIRLLQANKFYKLTVYVGIAFKPDKPCYHLAGAGKNAANQGRTRGRCRRKRAGERPQ